jgi:hypothetical protein
MITFPENPPRKQIQINWRRHNGELETICTTGVEVTPFIIHRKWDPDKSEPTQKGVWCVTHLFTGAALGCVGTYKFCKAVAEGISDEPLVWLPCLSMWNNNPDVSRVGKKLSMLKQQFENLGNYQR